MTHYYAWKKYRPEWYRRPCRIVARGLSMNSRLIEFADGTRAVVSGNAIRRSKP